METEVLRASPPASHTPIPALAFLLVFAVFVFWALYAQWSQYNLDMYGDMLENFAWGIRWQLGNENHPPLFGWITAAWFEVFPRTDIAYRFLSAANLAVGYLVMLHIAKRYLNRHQLVVAVAVALSLPLLGLMALTYNANSAMLPFWGLTFLAYLRVLERERVADALLLGLWAGLAMLAKYHSAVLLLALLIHSLTDPAVRRLWSGPLPIAAFAVFAAVGFPHAVWLYANDFSTFRFAVAEQGDRSLANVLYYELEFLLAQCAYALPGLGVAGLHRRWRDGFPLFHLRQFMTLADTPEGRALLAAGLLPVPLTIALGLVFMVPLTSNWSVPFFIFTPILITMLMPAPLAERHRRVAPGFVVVFIAVLLALSPVIRDVLVKQDRHNTNLPVREIAHAAEKLWAAETAAPLGYVAGDGVLAHGMAFYSEDRPQAVAGTGFGPQKWIAAGAVEAHGYMILCMTAECATRPATAKDEIRRSISVPPPDGAPSTGNYDISVFIRLPGA